MEFPLGNPYLWGISVGQLFFYYFIVINIILVDVFHDVTENKKTKQLCYEKIT